jgi:hypothetical protein
MNITRFLLLLAVAGVTCAQKINLDTQTMGRNLYWDNVNKRIVIGWNGSFSGVLGHKVDVKDAGPNWTALSTQYSAMRVSVNDFPVNAQFGSNLVGIPEAITGALDIPATATFPNHGTGVAGYARGKSTANGIVGVFGAGLAAADNVLGAWGANFLAANTATIHNTVSHALPLVGFNNTNLYGVEIDTGIQPVAGVPNPNVNVRGLYVMTAGSTESPSPINNAIDIDFLGTFQPGFLYNWKNGIYINDGAADVALNIGASGTGNNVGSQPIRWRGRTSGGADIAASALMDQAGNLIINPGGGAATAIQDGSGSNILVVSSAGVTVAASKPFAPGTFVFANIATALPGTGMMGFCTNCTSGSNPCTGGGTGALAILQGGAFKCF